MAIWPGYALGSCGQGNVVGTVVQGRGSLAPLVRKGQRILVKGSENLTESEQGSDSYRILIASQSLVGYS